MDTMTGGRLPGTLILLSVSTFLLSCSRSYFDEAFTAGQTCAAETLRCSGAKVQHCPNGVWQTMEDCALFDMDCSSVTGRVGCVETVDTEPDETDTSSAEIEDTETDETPFSDGGPDTDAIFDAGVNAGFLHTHPG